MSGLIETLKSHTFVPERDTTGPLVYAVDHCFSIRGQGTVLTGTVLSGTVAVNDVSGFCFSVVIYVKGGGF